MDIEQIPALAEVRADLETIAEHGLLAARNVRLRCVRLLTCVRLQAGGGLAYSGTSPDRDEIDKALEAVVKTATKRLGHSPHGKAARVLYGIERDWEDKPLGARQQEVGKRLSPPVTEREVRRSRQNQIVSDVSEHIYQLELEALVHEIAQQAQTIQQLGPLLSGPFETSPDELVPVLVEMGVRGSASRLLDSLLEPAQCMRQATTSLEFLGLLGSKWVIEPRVRAEFRAFLDRMQTSNGRVQFLLIDPTSQAFRDLAQARGGGISAESLDLFAEFDEAYDCLQVRLSQAMPCFRLVFLDHSRLAVSRYQPDTEGYIASRFGWEAPHLLLTAEAPWSLYSAFALYFEQTWTAARPLQTVLAD